MAQRVISPQKEFNWCATGVDPYTVFAKTETVHQFDPKYDSFAKLLVWSGICKSFREAYLKGFTGKVVVGWTSEVINGVGIYIYNPIFHDAPWREEDGVDIPSNEDQYYADAYKANDALLESVGRDEDGHYLLY